MPRNDQFTRQWILLSKIEASRGASIRELVESLPEDLPRHPRTIRRDLEALAAAGIPLYTDRADGVTRWKLLEGFNRVPALRLSPTELMALVFSRHLLKPLEGTEIQAALGSALNKAAAALPPQTLDYLRKMESVFSVGLGPHKSYRSQREIVDRVADAIARSRTVQIRYFSASRNTTTRREVDPYRLWYAAGGLYLIGYCHLRRDVRMFAVERIRSLTLTDHPYQLPLGFDIEAYVRDALVVMRGRRIEVELVFSRKAAAWVRDKIWHGSQELFPLKDGGLRMLLRVADTDELLGWVLSFGAEARVVRPESLRRRVKAEAAKIVAG